MTDIFISYKREDEARVLRLVRALEGAGFTVWWDRGLPGGEEWRTSIERALNEAKVVIAVWTHGSVSQDGRFVREEASQALARNALVPVRFARVSPPLGFREVQAIDLWHWRGNARDPFFLDLVAAVRAKLAGEPAPKATGPVRRAMRRLFYGGLAGAAAAALAVFLTNALNVQNQICSIPLAQPGLSDVCGAMGLGEKPTRRARLAFEALPAGNCEALRDFAREFETSPLRRTAVDRINARRTVTEETWVAAERLLPLSGEGAGASETAARDAALAASQGRANQRCGGLAASTLFRLRSAAPRADTWTCAPGGAGVACSFEGHAVCATDERVLAEREICE